MPGKKNTKVNKNQNRSISNLDEDHGDLDYQPKQTTNNIAHKYGNVPVVKASFHLLLSFLLRQLGYLSTRNPQYFGSIVEWATNVLNDVVSFRDSFRDVLEETAYDNKKSSSAQVFGCEKRYTIEGKAYSYSLWYSSFKNVKADFLKENPRTLGESNCVHLLAKIWKHLDNAFKQLKRTSNCDYDFNVLERVESYRNYFHDTMLESEEELEKLEQFREEQSKQRRSEPRQWQSEPKQNKTRTKSTQVHLKSETAPTTSNTVEVQPKKADVIVLPESKSVVSGVSYLNIAKGISPQPTPAILTIVDDSTPVVDLNSEAEEVSVLSSESTTDNVQPVTLSAAEKKRLKRAAQRARKAAAKLASESSNNEISEMLNVSMEEPTEACELAPVTQSDQTDMVPTQTTELLSPQVQAGESQPQTDSEMVEVRFFSGYVNGTPTFTTGLMTRAEYNAVKKVDSV